MLLEPEKREFPQRYLKEARAIFRERKLSSIVEIGCIRSPLNHPIEEFTVDDCAEGHSSVFWATETDDFVTIDISKENMELCLRECKKHTGRDVNGIAMDGIEYLKSIRYEAIDLLYLDAFDVGLPYSAENHLVAFQEAEKNLHENSLVLIDDTDCIMRDNRLHFSDTGLEGKGQLLIPYALDRGWKILFSGRQTLLTRK